MNLPYSKRSFFVFDKQISVPRTTVTNKAGLVVPGWPINITINSQDLNKQVGYVIASFSFSASISESMYQSGLEEGLSFQFVNTKTGASIMSDKLISSIYYRQFHLDYAFKVTSICPLGLSIKGYLIQSPELAAIGDISFFINYFMYRVADQKWIADNLKD